MTTTQVLPTFIYPDANSTDADPRYTFHQNDFVNVSWTVPAGTNITDSMSYNSLLTMWCSGQTNQTWSTQQAKGSVEWLTMGPTLWYLAPLNFPPPADNGAASTCWWSFWVAGWNEDKQLKSGSFIFSAANVSATLWTASTERVANGTASATRCPDPDEGDDHTGALIGMGVVIGILALAILGLLGMLLRQSRRWKKRLLQSPPPPTAVPAAGSRPSSSHPEGDAAVLIQTTAAEKPGGGLLTELSDEQTHEMPEGQGRRRGGEPVYEMGVHAR